MIFTMFVSCGIPARTHLVAPIRKYFIYYGNFEYLKTRNSTSGNNKDTIAPPVNKENNATKILRKFQRSMVRYEKVRKKLAPFPRRSSSGKLTRGKVYNAYGNTLHM